MTRSEKAAAEAKGVEERLRAEGRHTDAEAVKRLRLSAERAVATCGTLHRSNMKLRQRFGLLSFETEGGQ